MVPVYCAFKCYIGKYLQKLHGREKVITCGCAAVMLSVLFWLPEKTKIPTTDEIKLECRPHSFIGIFI